MFNIEDNSLERCLQFSKKSLFTQVEFLPAIIQINVYLLKLVQRDTKRLKILQRKKKEIKKDIG